MRPKRNIIEKNYKLGKINAAFLPRPIIIKRKYIKKAEKVEGFSFFRNEIAGLVSRLLKSNKNNEKGNIRVPSATMSFLQDKYNLKKTIFVDSLQFLHDCNIITKVGNKISNYCYLVFKASF